MTTAVEIRPVRFILPANFKPEELLPEKLREYGDDARLLVHTIVRKMLFKRVDHRGYARLNFLILRRSMRPNTVAKIIRSLKERGVLETAPHNQGFRPIGYKLTEQYLSAGHIRRACRDLGLLLRINREQNRVQEATPAPSLPIHEKLDAAQRCVGVSPDIDGRIARLPPRSRFVSEVLIEHIRREDFQFSVSQYGRVFNCFSSVKRELRSDIRLSNEQMSSIDLRCCQPALLAIALGGTIPTFGYESYSTYRDSVPPGAADCLRGLNSVQSSELDLFRDLTCSGRFNDWLAEKTGLSRSVAKRRFLVDVLAKRGCYRSHVEEIFGDNFPSILRAVKAINRDGHETVIRLLQRLESCLVVEQVAPKLVDRIPIVTLHDAIFSRTSDIGLIEEAFQETFRELGFSISLHRQAW